MRTRVKICCIQNRDEARLAIRSGADCIGLVAEMPSGPGPVADEVIAAIAVDCPPGLSTFLLTSRTDPGAVVEHVIAARTNVVQLVDAVPTETYDAIRDACPAVRIVQVVHVEGGDAVGVAEQAAPHVDAILLDSGRPNAAVKELGGTGRTHDWEVSSRVVAGVPVPVWGLQPRWPTDALGKSLLEHGDRRSDRCQSHVDAAIEAAVHAHLGAEGEAILARAEVHQVKTLAAPRRVEPEHGLLRHVEPF